MVDFSGSSLAAFKLSMQKNLFGITLADAHTRNICIKCKEAIIPRLKCLEDESEWRISGLCPECFEEMAGDPDSDSSE